MRCVVQKKIILSVLGSSLAALCAAQAQAASADMSNAIPATNNTANDILLSPLSTFSLKPQDSEPQLALIETAPETSSTTDQRVAGPLLPAGSEVAVRDSGSPRQPYSLKAFSHQAGSVLWEVGGVAAVLSAFRIGRTIKNYSGFHFQSEGWFGRNTYSLGTDKLTHAWETYLITDFLTSSINRNAGHPSGSVITAGILAMGLITYSESFDGMQAGHGFSYEDVVADAAGAAFSIIRNSVPGLKEKLDFRIQYIPSNNVGGFHPLTDFSGQKHLLALQLSGFKELKTTPLRFVELHAGYYARGFTEKEKLRGDKLRRELFVGVGLNIKELLFGRQRSNVERVARNILDYVQVPYTAINSR